jgi:hypothetical protein
MLTTAAQTHVAGMGHDDGSPRAADCAEDLPMFMKGVTNTEKSRSWRREASREVADVKVQGDRATVIIEFENGRRSAVPLVKTDGQWKVDALFGGIPAAQQDDHY